MGGGRAPSAGVESKLQPNGKSYKNKILGMWTEFSLDVFHQKISKKFRALRAQSLVLSDGVLPPPWIQGYFLIKIKNF